MFAACLQSICISPDRSTTEGQRGKPRQHPSRCLYCKQSMSALLPCPFDSRRVRDASLWAFAALCLRPPARTNSRLPHGPCCRCRLDAFAVLSFPSCLHGRLACVAGETRARRAGTSQTQLTRRTPSERTRAGSRAAWQSLGSTLGTYTVQYSTVQYRTHASRAVARTRHVSSLSLESGDQQHDMA